jgi:hypothetical protein
MNDLERGFIKLPEFQRDFVWPPDQSATFLDSIFREMPIGTFTVWKTTDRLQSVKNLGNFTIPDTPPGESVQYVLDGQQRLATLFAVCRGEPITRRGKKTPTDYSEFYVDLDADPNDNDQNIVLTEKPPTHKSIKILDLIDPNPQASLIQKEYPDQKHQNQITHYREVLQTYNFSIIEIHDARMAKAVEIFIRINTGGTKLVLFEIMIAITYDKNFNLRKKYDDLNAITEQIGFKVPPQSVLQLISLILSVDCKSKTILSLNKNDIINLWDAVSNAIKLAIGFLQTDFKVVGTSILPTAAFFVTFGYFFYKHGKPQPSDKQCDLLKKYFWKSALSERYSGASETAMANDVKQLIDEIVKGNSPQYGPEFNFKFTEQDIISWPFSLGSTITKSIMCLLTSKGPLRFDNNSPLNLQNNFLVIALSRNYHHFFPQAYLKKTGHGSQSNLVMNITLVDDFLNKRVIRDKAPSVYMAKWNTGGSDENKKLAQTMTTHFIDDLDGFGVWKDDYVKFIQERGKLIYSELQKLVA